MKKIISLITLFSLGLVILTGLVSFSTREVSAQNIGSLKNVVSPGFTFRKDLRLGDTDPDVRELQRVLNADVDTMVATEGDGSPGKETTSFGNLTKNAVIKFQNKYRDVVLTINSITTADGVVNRPTRTKLNLLIGEFNTYDSVGSPQSRASSGSSSNTVAYVPPATIVVNNQGSMSVCQFIELLITIDVIPTNKITAARSALGCSTNNDLAYNNDDEYDSTPASTPAVNLKVNGGSTATIKAGVSVTLSWTSKSVNSCSANWGNSLGVSGSKVVTVSTSTIFSITCSGTKSVSDSVFVYVGSGGATAIAANTTSNTNVWTSLRLSDIKKNIISSIGLAEVAGPTPTAAGRPGFPVIATDSKNQPHILVKGEGNSGLYNYNKIGSTWNRSVPLVIRQGGPGNPDIEIDDRDNAWISGNTVVQNTTPSSLANCSAAISGAGGAFGGTWEPVMTCSIEQSSSNPVDAGISGATTGASAGALVGGAALGPVGAIAGGVAGGVAGGALGTADAIFGGGGSGDGKVIAVTLTGLDGCEGQIGLIGFTAGNIQQAMSMGVTSSAGGGILGQSTMGEIKCGDPLTEESQDSIDDLVNSGKYIILGSPVEGNWGMDNNVVQINSNTETSPLTGNWVGFMSNISARSVVTWFNKVAHKHFVGNTSVDPFYPGKAFFMGSQPDPIIEFTSLGSQRPLNTMSPGKSGEKIIFEITPQYGTSTATTTISGVSTTTVVIVGKEGIKHAASGGYNGEPGGYINSTMSTRVPWAGTNYAGAAGNDGSYVSLGIDWKKPKAAYIASSYAGVVINIWDGAKMLFPANSLHVIDPNPATFGNGIRRFAPQWTPAQGGGAFLCWTGSDGNIKMKYITTEGVNKFGPTTNVAKGSQCAMSTDTNGNIDLTYIVGSTVEYKKITTTVAP
jgi:peptidoglycan hydrolase-like protein with peptidoglycan-binding domain